jgi:DNA-directed RNA polymerase specialized sigma24 family protein
MDAGKAWREKEGQPGGQQMPPGGAAVRSYGSQGTHPSLLSRVRDPGDHVAWREFESRYRDLLLRFCRRRGMQHADAEDVVQVVLTNMAKALPRFVYDRRRGRFRDYLYRCTRNVLSRWQSRPKSAKGALIISVEDLDAVDSGSP